MANAELGSVTLSGRYPWSQRQVNKFIRLGRIAANLSHYGLSQKEIKIENRGLLDGVQYWHAPSKRYADIPYAKALVEKLDPVIEKIILPGGMTAPQIKNVFSVLLKTPLEILQSSLSEYGIRVKGPSGEDLKMPVSWHSLHDEIVPVNFGEKIYGLGCLASSGGGLLGLIALAIYDNHGPFWECATFTAIGSVAGFLLIPAIRGVIWASTMLSRMASFGRDYQAVFDGCNGIELDQKGSARIQSVLARAKGSRATVAHVLPYELAEKHLTGSDKDALLVEHPKAPKNKLIELANHSESSIRAKAIQRLKEQLTLSEIETLKYLNQPEIFNALFSWDSIPNSFFLPYFTGQRPVPLSVILKHFDRFAADFTANDLSQMLLQGQSYSKELEQLQLKVINHQKCSKPIWLDLARKGTSILACTKALTKLAFNPTIVADRQSMLDLACGANNPQIRKNVFDRLGELTTSELDQLDSKDSQILERVATNLKVSPQKLAILLNDPQLIPKSKKIIDQEEVTTTEAVTDWTSDYINSLQPSGGYVTSYNTVVITSEISHQEYSDADVARAFGFLQKRDPGFVSQVMVILEKTNSELHSKLAIRLS